MDGTGAPWFRGDIGIAGSEIARIGARIECCARKIIQADDCVATPGFIDTHTHSDLLVLEQPEEEVNLHQGITTVLLGQDGLSVAPVEKPMLASLQRRISGLLGSLSRPWSWLSMAEYLAEVDAVRPATNKAMLVPHGNIRAAVLGWEPRPASAHELHQMKQMLARALGEGGHGLSTGLIYPPCSYADRRELLELTRLTGELGGFFVVHMRNESDFIAQSLREVIDICREASCPLHISHLKIAGRENWGRAGDILKMIDRARADYGMDVTFDQYPYIAGSTMFDAIIPPELHEGGTERMLERLQDPRERDRLRRLYADPGGEWENWVRTCGWDNIVITSVQTEKNRHCEGHSVATLAEQYERDPVDVAADLLLEEDNAVTMAVFYGSEDDVETIMQHQGMSVCSDGIMGGKPHPRVYGAFPRILGRYVRERGVLSLEGAVHRMTGNPAARLNLQDRGILREGMRADITVFDPDEVIDTATYSEPANYPRGIAHVIVNGTISLREGEITGHRGGEVIY